MANPFLNKTDLVDRDIETALLLEKAFVFDIGKSVAYTDGDKVFVNTDDNLFEILPAYNQKMLKWLLWHEEYHKQLKHHNRFFKYLDELKEEDTLDEFHVSKEEVNIIMDILVHDLMADKFPELVETAKENLAQMRNRNSLGYTFKTHTLEEMLKEYADFKHADDKDEDGSGDSTEEDTEETEDTEDKSESKSKSKKKKKDSGDTKDKSESKGHEESSSKSEEEEDKSEDKPEDKAPEVKDESAPEPNEQKDEHDDADWDKLDDIDPKEFITKEESNEYQQQILELKNRKIRLANLTETLNSLVTSTRKRSYKMPSTIHVGGGVLMKGSTPGRTQLYLCFDASGSMGMQLATFKEIISKSIPQAMQTPTSWFSGYKERVPADPKGRDYDYYTAKFEDIMPVIADGGYSDDGDRTIELCYLAEQKGYSPIGVTDGGGGIYWSQDMLKQLKRTVLVGQEPRWLEEVKKINPRIQTISI